MTTTAQTELLPTQEPLSPSDDLDEELEAIFDAPSSPLAPSPHPQNTKSSLPPPITTPATVSAAVPRRSILDALVAKKDQLTGHAAQLAADVSAQKSDTRTGFAVPSRLPIAEAMMQRRTSQNALSEADAARQEESRRRRARNAFKAIRMHKPNDGKDARGKLAYLDDKFCNMALREAVFPQEGVQALFEHCVRVDVSEITGRDDEMRTGRLGEFVIFGCLVKKHAKKEARNGKKYAVWSICNMPRRGSLPGSDGIIRPTVVTLLLFDEAFQAYHTQVEGSVFAFRKPQLLPPRGSETGTTDVRGNADWSGHCLNVTREQQVIHLGICKDFKLCEIEGPNFSVCGNWYDSNRMEQCAHHTRLRRKRLMRGTRMDVNNAERPSYAKKLTDITNEPNDISKTQRGGSYDQDPERREDDAHVRRKKMEDLEKTRKLKRSKIQDPKTVFEQAKAKESEVRSKVTGSITRKQFAPKPVQIRSAGKEPRIAKTVKHEHMQVRYIQAIDFLISLGYKLGVDGSLTAPSESHLCGKKLTLKRKQESGRKVAGSSGVAGSIGSVDVILREINDTDEKTDNTASMAKASDPEAGTSTQCMRPSGELARRHANKQGNLEEVMRKKTGFVHDEEGEANLAEKSNAVIINTRASKLGSDMASKMNFATAPPVASEDANVKSSTDDDMMELSDESEED